MSNSGKSLVSYASAWSLSDLNAFGLFLSLCGTRKRDVKNTVLNLGADLVFLDILRQTQSLLVVATCELTAEVVLLLVGFAVLVRDSAIQASLMALAAPSVLILLLVLVLHLRFCVKQPTWTITRGSLLMVLPTNPIIWLEMCF